MKDIFKISSFALALVALASCSNDDLLLSENGATPGGKNALAVSVEPVQDGLSTRAMADVNASVTWEASDKIKVYDDQLHMWDGYQFNGSAFTLFTAQDLAEAKFALYPFGKGEADASIADDLTNGGVVNTSWSKGGKTTATFEIPAEFTYTEDAENETYWLSAPMWGTVESVDGNLNVNLKRMTALLQVKLENVDSHAKTLEIRAFEDPDGHKAFPLNGDFEAELFPNDPDKTQIESTAAASTTDTKGLLSIDLSKAKIRKSVIYVPVPVMKNAIVKLYLKDASSQYMTLNEEGKLTAAGSTATPYKILSQKNYLRNTIYRVAEAKFAVSGATVSELNTALQGEDAAKEDVIIIEAESSITKVAKNDNTIYIPTSLAKRNIVLDLQSLVFDSGEKLVIMSENVNTPYEGTLTLKVAQTVTGNIETHLPKATVQMVGNYTTGELTMYAKGIIVGDGNEDNSTSLNFKEIGAEVEAFEVMANATCGKTGETLKLAKSDKKTVVTVEGKVYHFNADAVEGSTITVQGKGETSDAYADGDITYKDEAKAWGYVRSLNGNIQAKDKARVGNVKAVEGEVIVGIPYGTSEVSINGDITAKGNVRVFTTVPVAADKNVTSETGYVTLKDAVYSGTGSKISAATKITLLEGAKAVDVELLEGGESVTVNVKDGSDDNSGECEAITGTLTLHKGATLNLTQGYVKTVNAADTGLEEDEFPKITFGKNPAYTAIYQVTGSHKITNASVWNGKTLPSKYAVEGKYLGGSVYTANQLASRAGSSVWLCADIDLGINAWTPVTQTGKFDGNGHTITGGKVEVKDQTNNTNAYVGLFSILSGNVSNLTIDGLIVSASTKKDNTNGVAGVGALAGKTSGSVTIENVDVKNASLTSTDKVVGGLIGEADGTLTITGDKESTAKYSTVATTLIQGENNLGGIVGKVVLKTSLTIKNYKAEPKEFVVTGTTVDTRDKNVNFGTVAPFVGTAVSNADEINIGEDVNDEGYKNTLDLTDEQRKSLHFEYNFISVSGATNTYYNFYGRKAIGYADNVAVVKIQGAASGITAGDATVDAVADIDKADKLNIYLKAN